MLLDANAHAILRMNHSAGQVRSYQLKRHELGFFQADPLPTAAELQLYYRDRYYQNPLVATYRRRYDAEEQAAQEIPARVTDHLLRKDAPLAPRSLLDVGCGEGIFMQAMSDLGWMVKGVDYSEEGVRTHRPAMLPQLVVGDSLELLRSMQGQGAVFGFVNLGNILEHVLDPLDLLQLCGTLLAPHGVLRVVVPNDGSAFQGMLESHQLAGRTWFAPPDHLSYFDDDSLVRTLAHCGYRVARMLGDFPIELYLLNESSNYVLARERGPHAHRARIRAVNFVASRGIEAYVRWAEGLAAGGTTRSCIAFAQRVDPA